MKFILNTLLLILISLVMDSQILVGDEKAGDEKAATSIEQEQSVLLSQRASELKAELLELNRDLFLLEEDLLHPVSTRLALYVSLDYGSLFKLEGVKLKLDGKAVTSFLYTAKDIEALKRGAIQPLYLGNISSGEHELVAFFTGIGGHDRPYKRAVSLKFEKTDGEKALEIQIVDDSASLQPQFKIKAWD